MKRLFSIAIIITSCISALFSTDSNKGSADGKIYGRGDADYPTQNASFAAAESRAISDLAKNVNAYLKAVGLEADSTFFYRFLESNGTQIVEYSISGFKVEESGTGEEGETYVVVSIDSTSVASSVRKAAEEKTAAINADIQNTEEDFAEALAELNAMAEAMKNHYETLMADYRKQIDETDPERVYEIFINAILEMR